MTHDEMRRRLAEAQGWTRIQECDCACRVLVGESPAGIQQSLPNPLDDDYDAARLRAWCVGQGWIVETRHTRGPSMASIAWTPDGDKHFCIVADTEEPDPCRRERLALCRAVLQAIEAQP